MVVVVVDDEVVGPGSAPESHALSTSTRTRRMRDLTEI